MPHVYVGFRMRRSLTDNTEYVTVLPPGTIILNKPAEQDMYHFSYNNVMLDVENPTVYDTAVKSVVQSVLDGYNGTLLAYGQTGSGKTYTMLGPAQKISRMDSITKGCIPRAMEHLFHGLQDSEYMSWNMQVSYIEIYQNKILDLLRTPGQKPVVEGEITTGKRGETTIRNIAPTAVTNIQEVEALIDRGQVVRTQADNGINERSSRSHTILTVWLRATSSKGFFATKLNLVDLAGSERRNSIGEQSKRIHKEGDAINQSLLSLQRVVMALGRGEKPPFRESKLTHFLQDSLGGNCRTALLACAWGEPEKSLETISTCKFAESMMKVKMNAKQNKTVAVSNRVKLDPLTLAVMEERIRQRVDAERLKIIEELGNREAPARDSSITSAEKKELHELRRFKELQAEKQPELDQMQAELHRVQRELFQRELELEEANADLKLVNQGQAPGSESEAALNKLCSLKSQHQRLQDTLTERGYLSDDDQEELEFVEDEIQSLAERMQACGVHIPGMAPGEAQVVEYEEVLRSDSEVRGESEGRKPESLAEGPVSGAFSGLHSCAKGDEAYDLEPRALTNQPLPKASEVAGVGENMQHLSEKPEREPIPLVTNTKQERSGFISRLRRSFSGRVRSTEKANKQESLTERSNLQGNGNRRSTQGMVFLSPLDRERLASVLNSSTK